MRNKFTIYSPRTDLRGKKVELRDGRIVEIPKDAKRYFGRPEIFIIYEVPVCITIFQNFQREYNAGNVHDIMKVIS